jgi:hypothetical protein
MDFAKGISVRKSRRQEGEENPWILGFGFDASSSPTLEGQFSVKT